MKKRTIRILFMALPAFLVMSCKPALKVSSDYDRSANFSAYKTFSLYYLVTNKNVTELNEDRIWKSVRAEMLKKGYLENNNNPDLMVNAVSVVKNKKYISATSTGYGGVYRPYGYWGGGIGLASGSTTIQAANYKEGSLVIDIIDNKTNKMVWQGTGNAEFEKSPKNPDEVIGNAVNKIMANFPGENK